MITSRASLKASLPVSLAVAIAAAVVFTSGCSNMNMMSAPSNTPVMGAMLQGKVHGGQSPIKGSTIGLFVVGSSGYGSSGGANLLTTPVTSGPDGSFTISADYPCTAGQLVYLTATGGDPGVGSSNSSIVLAAPLGDCSLLSSSTFINVNEVTTAATAIALGQFFTTTFGSSSTDSIGTSATNPVGLTNAFATVNNLVNIATGAAVTSATLNGTGTGNGLSITATPESAKLNTIANLLAACVNSDGGASSPCQTTLFPDVVPTAGTVPTDTLQAAVYMSLNPTSNNSAGSTANLTALFGLQTPTAPFVGVATQPTDWTVGIQYQGSTVLSQAQNIAADASGNIWVVTNQSGAAGALAEFSPTGTPMLNSSLSTTTVNGGSAVSLTASQPRNLAIDINGNAWVTASSGSGATFEYNPNTTAATAFKFQASYGVTIDGNNNVFISDQSSSVGTTGNSFIEFLNGNMDPSTEIEYPADEAVIQPEYLAADTSGNVWASSGSATGTNAVLLSGINTSGCTAFPCSSATGLVSTYTTLTAGPINGPWAFAAAPAGQTWLANPTGNFLTNFAAGGASAQNFGSASSLNAPRFPAVDGAGNIWVGNRGTAAIAEFASNGTVLSPGTGYAHSGLASANQITLDPSGNVWIANNSTSTNANSIFEIVGSGAPTVTPIALALKDGKVGQKP